MLNNKYSQNFLLLCFGLFFSLVTTEIILRIADFPTNKFLPWISDDRTGFRLAENMNQQMVRKEFNVNIRTNEKGFRDDKIEEKDSFRILLLGDSFTMGYGAERDELFADLLEDNLGVDILNVGCGGFELIHQVRWFKNYAKQYDPDLVIYALYLGNDLSRNMRWKELADGNLDASHFLRRKKTWFKVIELARFLVYKFKARELDQSEWRPPEDYLRMSEINPSEETKQNYKIAKELLHELSEEVTRAGHEFFVFTFPYKTAVDTLAHERFSKEIDNFSELYDLNIPTKKMESFLNEKGIRNHSLTEAMHSHYEKNKANPLFFEYDGHFTPLGHSFVAKQLAPIIKPLLD
tara:strand:- start:351 stop:1400 length:1050 start_codon:yes stop_codon:yes gene_type:complete